MPQPARLRRAPPSRLPLNGRRAALLAAINACGTHMFVPRHTVLGDGDDGTRHLYFVESGGFEVSLAADPRAVALAGFRSGACFLLDFGARPRAICRATRDSEVIDLPLRVLAAMEPGAVSVAEMVEACRAFPVTDFLTACYAPPTAKFMAVPPAIRPDAAQPEGGYKNG